jgi:hypothetical protein
VLEEVIQANGNIQVEDIGIVEVETTDNTDSSVGIILFLGNNKENGVEWQEVRQSRRLRDNGTTQLMIEEHLKIKMS